MSVITVKHVNSLFYGLNKNQYINSSAITVY